MAIRGFIIFIDINDDKIITYINSKESKENIFFNILQHLIKLRHLNLSKITKKYVYFLLKKNMLQINSLNKINLNKIIDFIYIIRIIKNKNDTIQIFNLSKGIVKKYSENEWVKLYLQKENIENKNEII